MGTHPIFESDFDCLTEKNGLRIIYGRKQSMKAWGPELWDAVDKVDHELNERINKNDRTLKFLKEKSSIDAEYSKNLKKLVSRYQKNVPVSSEVTTEQAFIGLVTETHNIANQYEQIAEQVMSDCFATLQ